MALDSLMGEREYDRLSINSPESVQTGECLVLSIVSGLCMNNRLLRGIVK